MDAGWRNRVEAALERCGWWPIALVLAFDAALLPWLAHPYDVSAFLTHADRVFFAHVRPAILWPYGGVALGAVLLSQLPVAAFPQLWAAVPLRLALLKLPMLIADAGTALIIRRYAGSRDGTLWALRYLLDPAVFFVTVVHGQSDALAGVFAVAGIALMLSGRFEWAGVALGIGTGAKLYPAAFVPLLLVVAYRNGSPKRALASAAYFAVMAACTVVPVVAGRTAAFAGAFANNSFGPESRRVNSASPWALLNAAAPFVRPALEQLAVVIVPILLALAELRHRPQRVEHRAGCDGLGRRPRHARPRRPSAVLLMDRRPARAVLCGRRRRRRQRHRRAALGDGGCHAILSRGQRRISAAEFR